MSNTAYESFIDLYEGHLILVVTDDTENKLRILGFLFISKDAKILIEKNLSLISGFFLNRYIKE